MDASHGKNPKQLVTIQSKTESPEITDTHVLSSLHTYTGQDLVHKMGQCAFRVGLPTSTKKPFTDVVTVQIDNL